MSAFLLRNCVSLLPLPVMLGLFLHDYFASLRRAAWIAAFGMSEIDFSRPGLW